jgi:hypothetical protein
MVSLKGSPDIVETVVLLRIDADGVHQSGSIEVAIVTCRPDAVHPDPRASCMQSGVLASASSPQRFAAPSHGTYVPLLFSVPSYCREYQECSDVWWDVAPPFVVCLQ